MGTKYLSCGNKIISSGNKILYRGNTIFFSRTALISHRSSYTSIVTKNKFPICLQFQIKQNVTVDSSMRRTVIRQMLNYDGHDVHQHVLQDFGSVSIYFRRYISVAFKMISPLNLIIALNDIFLDRNARNFSIKFKCISNQKQGK